MRKLRKLGGIMLVACLIQHISFSLSAQELPQSVPSGTALYRRLGLAQSAWSNRRVSQAIPRGFLDRVYRDADAEHKYTVFVPENYTDSKQWPVILFLHGAGERGRDGVKQTKVGLGPYVKARAKTFPFIVVFPQCEDTQGRVLGGWLSESADGQRALKILDAVEKDFNIDKQRRVLTGWSMGGYGAWSIAAATPERWSAVVPIAGGGDPTIVKSLKDVPIWSFHGARDLAILPKESRKMVATLKAAGGTPVYSEIADAEHDVWQAVYDNDDVYAWMLDPSGAAAANLAVRRGSGPPRRTVAPDLNEPFVPAVEIPRAVYVRLGNRAIDAMAYSIPQSLSRDLLSGWIGDMHDHTQSEGRTFNVTFSGISYSGNLALVKAKAYAKDRLNIQLGLQNVQLSIGRTYVRGRSHSATAGPIGIGIGQNRPEWLSFDVMPYVANRKLRLRLLSTRFNIANDNWYVTAPAGVSTKGLGMTREKVSQGLVSGLYGSRARIEREITGMVPSLLGEIEEKLTLTDQVDLVNSFWPLPVYRPRIRVWTEEVATDANGVSLVFGVTAASIDPQKAPKTPVKVAAVGLPASSVPQVNDLRIGIAPQLLKPLTDLLIQADVARIHVLDLSEEAFRPLADPAVLAEAVPDLKRFGDDIEVWSELVLTEPLSVADVIVPARSKESPRSEASDESPAGDRKPAARASSEHRVQFRAPKIVIAVSIKTDADSSQWTPCAEFTCSMRHTTATRLLEPDFETRAFRLDWEGEPEVEVSGRFVRGYPPKDPQLHPELIAARFIEGWRAWTNRGPVSQVTVPDISFGRSRLRVSEIGWSDPALYATFSIPKSKITNISDTALVYETRGPNSGWGGPYTLPPGETHRYEIPYPLTYRRRGTSGVEVYTLPAGSHSEFRVPKSGGSPRLFQAKRKQVPQQAKAESADQT